MYNVIRSLIPQPNPAGTVKFEGEPYGSGISLFLVNNRLGEGPRLQKHPYSETWFVRAGKACFTADGMEMEAVPGDIVVVSAETPHKFINTGSDLLDIICIHASPTIIQEWLEE